jgi:hypothetical protein
MTGHTDKSPSDIVAELQALSESMLDTAANLDYFGGMNNQWQTMAQWLISASAVTHFFSGQVTKEPA